MFPRTAISIHALRVEGDHGCMRFKDLQAKISIHALRVEGDDNMLPTIHRIKYFYPRPPGGGRRVSGRADLIHIINFYPRPPGGGRQDAPSPGRKAKKISIHALRVEGDLWHSVSALLVSISIHALRVEGDENRFYKPVQRVISIHALRVEGDRICSACQ